MEALVTHPYNLQIESNGYELLFGAGVRMSFAFRVHLCQDLVTGLLHVVKLPLANVPSSTGTEGASKHSTSLCYQVLLGVSGSQFVLRMLTYAYCKNGLQVRAQQTYGTALP